MKLKTSMSNTFRYQQDLPLLPVPDLNNTCNKLIEWAQPLLTDEELTRTKKVVDVFLRPDGEGNILQSELIDWANRNALLNWAAPLWLDLYLESRDSLVINSNVFYFLKSKLDEKAYSQAHIAAALIATITNFISLIDEQKLSPDMQKDQPLCMNQYKNLFSSTRIPLPGKDKLKVSSSRKHIVVLHNECMYALTILDDNGNTRSPAAIESDLDKILTECQRGQNVGILTTTGRDCWADNRTALLDISSRNQAAMAKIEEAAFALCLDDNSPEELTDVSRMLLHGDGKNRYFDKSLQFIVFKNGKTGVNFEHTGMDGSVMLRLVGYIYDNIDEISFDSEPEMTSLPEVIEFDLNHELARTLGKATTTFNQHIANTQTRVLNFTQFGKDQIKKFRVSPDAFVQLALQLAEYKLYGKCYSAYEAVMSRGFLDGRIDVLYTVSPESMTFIRHMQDPGSKEQAKIDALIKAAQKHVERAKECRSGNGIYTHFLGLKSRYKAAGSEIGIDALPGIFTDKAYQALTHSVVCTSTTAEYGVELAGYGPIVEDGYGIRYFKRDDSICFNMTSRTEIQDKLDQMRINIEQSLLEMADLMQKTL